MCRGGSRIFEKGGGGSILGLQAKKRGRGPGGGPTLGPMLKTYIVAQNGGQTPWTPPPPPTPDPPMTCQELVDLSTRVRERVLHLSGLDPQLKSNQNPIIGQNHKSKGSEA